MKSGAFDHLVNSPEVVETRAQRLDYLRRLWLEDERLTLDAPHPRLKMGDRAYQIITLLRAGLSPIEVSQALNISRPRVDAAARGVLAKVRIPLGRT